MSDKKNERIIDCSPSADGTGGRDGIDDMALPMSDDELFAEVRLRLLNEFGQEAFDSCLLILGALCDALATLEPGGRAGNLLREYGDHRQDCVLQGSYPPGSVCTCGFDAALEGS